NPCTRVLNGIVYSFVALTGALMLVFATPLPMAFNVGMLTSLLSYANQYTKPFNEISGVVTELQNAVACAGRIYELIDEKPQQPDKPDAAVLENVSGEVEFGNVYFSYTADKKLIENLNIKAKAGQRIAIVGPTGCGKTTLINLLMRFYDTDSGTITVDGNEIKDVTRKSLRRNYGMVLQDTWLKSGTIKENISIGKPDATDEEIISAAKAAHSHNFIMQLPDGYETKIGEDGGNLSQGQKQLLCITRIMLCLPPMLILDEATSSIDTRTEQKIQAAFAKLMNGRTSFNVAHRLSTIKEADLILVMKDGNIIEQGTHSQLLSLGGFYSKLYNSQFAV
ncbi:MAG: ABC transporter ATP-binding protein/permease, partial [Clostridia bacterium]|nr:ABC transporter ATP-binding protein/permease [Clostridia bacterium]